MFCCCVTEKDGHAVQEIPQVAVFDQEDGPCLPTPRLDVAPELGQVQVAPAPAPEALAPAPAKAATGQSPQEITISITEADGDLNLDVGTDLAILRVRDGFFETWNKQHPDQCVGYLDRIISVNGSTARDEMTEKLQKPGNLVAIVRKAKEFRVVINKNGSSLGLDVVHSGNTSLHIKGLRTGMVEEYNKTCDPNMKIVPGDRLVEVCGVRDDSQKMLEQIKRNETVELRISHTRQI